MPETEPRLPSFDELRRIHEADPPAQPPSHSPNRPDYAELKREIKDLPQAERVNVIDDAEGKMAAYRKELQIDFEAGRIDKHEQVRREQQYDRQLSAAISSTPAEKEIVLPEPQAARTSQRKHDEGLEELKRQHPFKKEVADWDRMQEDPAYRKRMEQQAKDERAFRLQHQKGNEGPKRPDGRGL